MKIKFALATIIIGIILFSGIAFAQLPAPVTIKVFSSTYDGKVLPVVGGDVTITDVTKGIGSIFKTNQYGEIALDANTHFPNYARSDIFKATILDCKESPICSQEGELGNGVFFKFDLSGLVCPSYVDPEPRSYCGELGYILPSSCPACPQPVVEEDDSLIDFGLGMLITSSAFATWMLRQKYKRGDLSKTDFHYIISKIAKEVKNGSGFKVWFNDGKFYLKHLHYGIRGYHYPEQNHRKYNHPDDSVFVPKEDK